MKATCPRCHTPIEIDPATHATLQSQTHFACPACQGPVPVPALERPRVHLNTAPGSRTGGPARPAQGVHKVATASRKTNRNILILGATTLLVIGGIAFVLASLKSGDSHVTTQNIRNEIIHNSYFQNLIATGVTTMRDLDAIADIRPYESGFIGVSAEPQEWQQAQSLATRTGAEILSIGEQSGTPEESLINWLTDTFKPHLSPSAWVREWNQARVLVGSEILTTTDSNGERRVLLRWQSSRGADALLAGATIDQPFVNRLGMKFVPVPGTGVLMCIHETRRQDYAAYAADSSDAVNPGWAVDKFNGIPSGHEDEHPVCFVNLEDARGFCEWLSRKEGITFRLPSDHEWSHAVGIGNLEKRGPNTNPSNLHGSLPNVYPWGGSYPPRTEDKAGNYADLTLKEMLPQEPLVPGYRDGFTTTAPVMSFRPNNLGIHDLGGNLWEWCADQFKAADGSSMATLRGGSYNSDADYLLSSCRFNWPPETRTGLFGFRVVAELPPELAERQRILGLITHLGGTYEMDGTVAGYPVIRVSLPMTKPKDADIGEIKRLRGVKSLDLYGCYQLTDQSLAEIQDMTSLKTLILWGVHPITDNGFTYLSKFHDLEVLNIGYTGIETITGTGLAHLQKLTRLRSLGLNILNRLEDENLKYLEGLVNLDYLGIGYCSQISDLGIEKICRLPKLREIDLRETQVTDDGLMLLKNLPSLKKLWINGSRITADGLARFQAAVPAVEIVR